MGHGNLPWINETDLNSQIYQQVSEFWRIVVYYLGLKSRDIFNLHLYESFNFGLETELDMNSCVAKTKDFGFLAYLSRFGLQVELIGWESSWRPSIRAWVKRPSTLSNTHIFATSRLIAIKFYLKHH